MAIPCAIERNAPVNDDVGRHIEAQSRPEMRAAGHPRTLGWFSLTSIAMGGSMQSLFVIGALLGGQEGIPGQGTAAIPLLVVGFLLALMATPGWIELVLMHPNRVGGIAATCSEAFRPYNPVLANLTGVCYWWGWAFNPGLCAVVVVSAINQWYLPWLPVNATATGVVIVFTLVSLAGMRWVSRLAVPAALATAALAFLSALIPIFSGRVDWTQSMTFHLTSPFPGCFGQVTSLMAGLYLIGYAAPAYEQALSHVGETVNPAKNIPRAMYASAALAALYFVILPAVWLGTIGPDSLAKNLAVELGPVFAPLFGGAARAAAVGFIVFNMFTAIIAPLAGATRTLSQLADDGLLPRIFSKRTRTDAPVVATLFCASLSIAFLWCGSPLWLVAACSFCYLMSISLTSIAVWILRTNEPDRERPYRAPRGTITLGVVAAGCWLVATVLGFQQFGLPSILAGLGFAYFGAALYAWRKFFDRRREGLPGIANTIHLKLTGAMLLVLVLDSAGYLMAVNSVTSEHTALIIALEDIFVIVALLTITVGLVLPGMIAHAVGKVSKAANQLAVGTLSDFSKAMAALGKGDLDLAYANVDFTPVVVNSRDEIGDMARSFNTLQDEVATAAAGLNAARQGLSRARSDLSEINASLEQRVRERTCELQNEITVRKQVEENLSAQETWTRTIINSTADGIITFDHQNIVKSCNLTAQLFFGCDATDIIGRDVSLFIPSLAKPKTGALDTKGFVNFDECEFEVKSRHHDTRALALRLTEIDYVGSRVRIAVIQDITERKQAEENVAELNAKLMKAARQAGMADVASSVLHNIGNVLNSVTASSTLATETVRASKLTGLSKVVRLLRNHDGDLVNFLTRDPQGTQLPRYLALLEEALTKEQISTLTELGELNKYISHIQDIVVRQQALTGTAGISELVSISDIIEDALAVGQDRREWLTIDVARQYTELPLVFADKMKLTLILVNLFRNAKHALDAAPVGQKRIDIVTASTGAGFISISVSDNGIGIAPENMVSIFSGGFTTKKNGHGFGLHSSALAAQDMGGSLNVTSNGPGNGATFVLQIPLKVSDTTL